MGLFGNFKIGTRLGLGFAIVLLLIAGIVGNGVYQLSLLKGLAQAVDKSASLASTAQDWKNATTLNLARVMSIAKSGNNTALSDYLQPQMKDVTARISELQKSLEEVLTSDEEKKMLADIAANRKAYIAIRNDIFKLFKDKDESVNAMIDSKLTPSSDAYLKSIVTLSTHLERRQTATMANVSTQVASAEIQLIAMAMLVWLIGGVFSWNITHSITRPLGRASEAAKSVASGDLTLALDTRGQDETAQLLQTLSAMQGNLTQVVSRVREGAESVAMASAEIARGNNDMSSRTEHQASTLEETSASMHDLGSRVNQNADNAKQANQLAQSASTVAVKGGEVVSQVVDTMKGINDASKKIADIIGVIDGIAFQTNILALNAAVEAARAGEQGRGFAVVASEVRSLAGRSAEAAKEIKALIGASVERVERGTVLVDQAGHTMEEIVASIRRVTDIMGEINAASAEQSQGVAQVDEAISQIDQATQQNAALVEEMAAAASSLKGQADQLVQAVSVFKIAQGSSGFANSAAAVAQHSAPKQITPPAAPKEPAALSAPAAAPKAATPAAPAKTGGNDDWETF